MCNVSYIEWFNSVYLETYPTVRRCAYAFLRLYPDLKDEADDLIQETYIRMFNNKDKLYANNEVAKWLVVTLRNLVFNRVRVRKTRIKHLQWEIDRDQVFENTYADPASSVDEAFLEDKQEQLQKIGDHIGCEKLELLQEYYLDKVSLKDLAEREGISQEAMKMRISRLRKKCIEVLTIFILINTLLFRGFIHKGGERHENQYAREVFLRAGSVGSLVERNLKED